MHLLDAVHNWLSQPFQSGQSAEKWVLFVGLILVAAVFWQLVLAHIVPEIEG